MIARLTKRLSGAGEFLLGCKGTHFRKSLILILVISAIPGLIIGALIYWIVGGRIESELHRIHNEQIVHRAEYLDEQFSNLEMSISHWAFEPKFDYRLKSTDFLRDFKETWDLTRTLYVMGGSHPIAKSVELYLAKPRSILFSPEYNVPDSGTDERYRSLLTHGKTIYWTEFARNPDAPEQKELTLVHKIPGNSSEPFGILVVSMDRGRVAGLLKALSPYSDGESFIMQEDGSVLLSTGSGSAPAPPGFEQELKRKVREEKVPQGSFIIKWNKVTYTVSYGVFQRLGTRWTYVSAAPINAIMEPVLLISRLIWAMSFAALFVAAVLAWFASRRIYSPLDRVVRLLAGEKPRQWTKDEDEFKLIERQWRNLAKESSTLRSKLDEQLQHMKEGFLLQLIQGYLYAYSEPDLRERMKHYGWAADDRRFVILYMQLTGFSNPEGRFSPGDEGLVTFATANMAKELAASHAFQAEVVNFHDLTLGLLAVFPRETAYQKELAALSEEIMQAISNVVKMRVTITISRSSELMKQIPALFEEARNAASYRAFENANQIIDIERTFAQERNDGIRYSFPLEREIVQALRTGQEEEAERLVAEFLKTLSGEGAIELEVRQAMLQLLGSIQHTIMQAGISPNELFKGKDMYEQLSRIREPNRMRAWFAHKVIAPFVGELKARSDFRVKKMIENVMIYMQNRYMHDISLENCADRIGTNTYFLSKAFKQVTGKNFIDYLTELRMDKAKELLGTTDRKINDIAEMVGYQHSYFNRIFKKQENMTPTQYREFSRKSEASKLSI